MAVLARVAVGHSRLPPLPSQAAVPHMRPGGAVVNTTSIQSKDPSPQLLAYASTKGAISNFTAALTQMLATEASK